MKFKKTVYSCSGCSSAAQMANDIAIKLDREEIAEMSCIAGVGGGVASLVRKAKQSDFIVGIDGCPLQCVSQCLKQHNLKPDLHFDLSNLGIDKCLHKDYSQSEFDEIFEYCVSKINNS